MLWDGRGPTLISISGGASQCSKSMKINTFTKIKRKVKLSFFKYDLIVLRKSVLFSEKGKNCRINEVI